MFNFLTIGLLLFSALVSASTIFYFMIKGKKRSRLFLSYQWCQMLVFIWIIGYLMEKMFADSGQERFIYIKIQYAAICFIGLAWLYFSICFTERKTPRKPMMIALFSMPISIYILVLTNDYHKLFYHRVEQGFIDRGVLFWVHTVESYLLIIIGTVLLVGYTIRQYGYKQKQSLFMIFAVCVPAISNVLIITPLTPPGIDITPISFSFSLVFFAIATFRYRFLNIVPIALKEIVSSMKEAVVVIDNLNRIVNYNKAFYKYFKNAEPFKIDDSIRVISQSIKVDIEHNANANIIINAIEFGTNQCLSGEIHIKKPIDKFFYVNIQPIVSGKEILGRVITFNDVSEYKNLLVKLDEKNGDLSAMNEELTAMNEELIAANEQLKDYAETIEELAVTKERNRFARDSHDTLGHTMTLLIALIEVCGLTCKKDIHKTEEKLKQAADIARDGLKELRRSISGLSPEKLETENMILAIKNLVEEFRTSDVNIEFEINGDVTYYHQKYAEIIYRTCQESLTNSLRHGKAKNIIIILKLTNNWIKLFIFDDGKGCKNIHKGYGLQGMEHRVKQLNGNVVYGSDGETGFNIRLEIPVTSN